MLRNNLVHDNRRFGLNLYDGAYGDGSGSLTSTGDMYWGNGIGVMVDYGSTNKSITKATIHDNDGDGVHVGVSGKAKASLKLTSSIVTSNGAYGLWLVTGSTASVSYVAYSGNATAATKGSPTSTYTNTKPAGYLTTSASSGDFLRIASSSYQYTAGPSRTPIGARH